MKTIKEWLNELEEPYRTQALQNLDKDMAQEICKSSAEALQCAFSWMESVEGPTHWLRYYMTLKGTVIKTPKKDLKTIGEWLELLPLRYRDRAIKYVTEYPNNTTLHTIVGSLSFAIDVAFRWENTPEGYAFWHNVYSAIVEGKITPEEKTENVDPDSVSFNTEDAVELMSLGMISLN